MKKYLVLLYFLRLGVLAAFLFPINLRAAAGDLYVADPADRAIYRFTPDGSKSIFASDFYQPTALAFDARGNLFVGDSGSCASSDGSDCNRPSLILRFTPSGERTTFATLSSELLLGLAFDGAGNLFVSDGDSILKFSPQGVQSTFASRVAAWPLAFDYAGNLYAAVNPIGLSSILKFAPDGSSSTFVTPPAPTSSIVALAFGPGGDLFAVRGGDSIVRISPDGSSTTFANGNFQGNSLAFGPNGNLFAGQNAFNTSEPAILEFKPAEAVTFAFGVLLPSAFAFEPVTEKLHNLSARGLIQTGDNVLIGGFILGGNALANNAIVVRAIGPSLSSAGITNPLSDPTLEIRNSAGALIATNNDWQETQQAELTAIGLAPGHSRDSAIYATLQAGAYTAIVRGSGGGTGIALVEVYNVRK